MLKNITRSTLLHPVLFSIFPVIFLYSHNAYIVPFRGFVIPLFLSIFVTLLLLIAVRFILKNKIKSAFIVSLFVFLSLNFGHFTNLLTSYETIFEISDVHVFAIFGILVIGGSVFFIKTKRKLDNATIITNSIVVILVVISLINIGNYNLETFFSDESTNYTQTLVVSETYSRPDVYFLMLDGYANKMILQKYFDYDNQGFIDSLRDRGFFVPDKYTNSNYPKTYLSIPSILNMEFVDSLVSSEASENYRVELLYKAIDNNIVMQNFKAMGYKNISFDSGWFGTRVIDIADENLCENPNVDWRVLQQLKDITILPTMKILNKIIQSQILDQKHQQITCEFSELHQINKKFEEPVFVFMHVLAPHPSWVFDSNGDRPAKFVGPNDKDVKKRQMAYLNQMEYINKKTIESIEKILSESDNEPIIIILSDHGTRIVPDKRTGDEDKIIKYGNFMAFYLPNEVEPLAYETTPVNTFRLIFNSYFKGNYKILDHKVFDINPYKEIKEWDKKVGNVLG